MGALTVKRCRDVLYTLRRADPCLARRFGRRLTRICPQDTERIVHNVTLSLLMPVTPMHFSQVN
jgi:hypothetical protein